MKKLLLILGALLLGIISYAQTDVVLFPLTGDLNYQTPPTPPAGTTLNYFNSSENTKTPTFQSNWLRGTGAGDYLELSIDASSLDNLAIYFDARFSSGLGFGTWIVYANTGPINDPFQEFARIRLGSIFGSTSNGTLLEGLPAAANGNSDLKIRIQVDFGWNIADNLRISNLKLLTGNPKIKIYNVDAEIPNNSDASTGFNTVFSELQTLLEPGESKTYRVRNFNGTNGSLLNVSNIEIEPASGTTSNDFIVSTTNNITNLNVVSSNSSSPYGEITIKFVPQGEGVRRATVKVYSNGTPSPYSFTVIGGGKSCDVSNTAYVINTADGGVQTLPSDLGTADFVGQTANSPLPTGILSNYYPRPGNLYTSASTSWYTKDDEKIKTFGGVNGIDVSNLKNVSVEFNVAAFANANSDRGVSIGDYIILSVTDKDGNWFDVMQLNGSDDNRDSRRRKYQFNTKGKIFSKNYAVPLTLLSQSNSNSDTGTNGNNGGAYARFKFSIPLQYSKDLTNFKFKIRAKANINAVWLIDDISIKSNNAKFKTWDGSKWVPNPANQRPDKKEKAVFDGDYNFTAGETLDLTVCECEVNAGKTLTIPAGKTLTVQGNVINNGTAANFLVSSDANLIQKDPGAQNIGNITVERSVTNLRNYPGSNPLVNAVDYVYWSSPVANQNLQAFSPGTPPANILQYNEATDYFVTSYDGVFKPAKGYAIRAEGGPSPTPYSKTYQFVGSPNNGDYKIAINRSLDNPVGVIHGYNLIGNPYPSNIDFDILFANNSSLIYKTAWFWKNNSYTPNQQGQGYTGNNYIVYNGTGPETPAANGIVKVGQGFLIQKKNSGSDSLVFSNLYTKTSVLRVSTAGTFYQKNTTTKNRFWLKLISPDDVENTQLIGYVDGATDGFEMDYDAEAFGLSSNLFYSLLDNKRLLIQGKANQFTNEDRVNLGANFFKNGNYTIEVEQPEGIFTNGQTIYLKDKLTGTITNLSLGSYTFEANKGVTEGRFEIIYKPETVLVTDNKVKGGIVVYRDSDNFVVQAPKIIATVEVYDLSGKLITVLKSNTNQAVLNASFFNKGMYVLRIKTIDGEITNKKIIK